MQMLKYTYCLAIFAFIAMIILVYVDNSKTVNAATIPRDSITGQPCIVTKAIQHDKGATVTFDCTQFVMIVSEPVWP